MLNGDLSNKIAEAVVLKAFNPQPQPQAVTNMVPMTNMEPYNYQQSGPHQPGEWYRGSRGQNGKGYRPWQGGGGRGPWNQRTT